MTIGIGNCKWRTNWNKQCFLCYLLRRRLSAVAALKCDESRTAPVIWLYWVDATASESCRLTFRFFIKRSEF